LNPPALAGGSSIAQHTGININNDRNIFTSVKLHCNANEIGAFHEHQEDTQADTQGGKDVMKGDRESELYSRQELCIHNRYSDSVLFKKRKINTLRF